MNARDIRILGIGAAIGLGLAIGGYALKVERAKAALPPSAEEVSAAPASNEQPTSPTSVQLTPEEEKSIALRTVEATHRELHDQIATVGKVDEAETRLATIASRVAGRIEKLHITFTGQPVGRGQAVADIYSPDLLNAAQEYRLALDNRERLRGTAQPDALAQADELIAASKRRLELWGMTDAQIDKAAANPVSAARVTTYSNAAGIVNERKVSEGQYVNTGDALYAIADLSTVWVKLDVYESDLAQIRVGDSVEMTCDAVPGKIRGRIDFVDTTVNHDTRTASLRVQVSNPGMRLRPGMYVRATIFAAPQMALVVPRSAVIDTGTRSIVYVARGNGVYEAREVRAGQASGDLVPISSGLNHGDRVVTEGSFLVDSQTRLSGGMTAAFGGAKDFNAGAKAEEASGAAGQASQLKLEFSTSPDPPKGDSPITYRVKLTDDRGQPITDAQVRVDILMPAMPAMNMGPMKTGEDLKWNGSVYTAVGNMPMAGSWTVTVVATRAGQTIATYKSRLNAR